jgi:hypothetical protein
VLLCVLATAIVLAVVHPSHGLSVKVVATSARVVVAPQTLQGTPGSGQGS